MSQLRKNILAEFSILPSELNRIISTAPYRYKVFYIPKKNAGELRELAQPAQELKVIQNWLVNYLVDRLPVHKSAMAYIAGKGIKDNALFHNTKRYVLKMDFENFFPSVGREDIVKHLSKYGGEEFSSTDIDDICKIVLWSPPNKKGRFLCIGAPSSPFISNSIMYDFDKVLSDFCAGIGVGYTRYADDLIFSTNNQNVLNKVESFVFEVLKEIDYPKLIVNKKKTKHTSKGRGISVTGIVLTPEGKLSLGRERKRVIRSTIHYFLNQKLSYKEVQKLNGMLAFTHDIEPEFIENMKLKYGVDFLIKIKNYLIDNNLKK
jgi:retron-type reverse transcriptase